MADYFVDSSVLTKRYIREAGSDWVCDLLTSEARIIVSRLSLIEITAALVRRTRNHDLTRDELEAALDSLQTDFRSRYEVIELSGSVMTRALALGVVHGLRAADTLQLACASVAASSGNPDEFRFVSADLELNKAAIAEGLATINPTHAGA